MVLCNFSLEYTQYTQFEHIFTGDSGWHGIDGHDGIKGLKGDRGYTFPYELAPRGEPGFDGIPGRKGEQGRISYFLMYHKNQSNRTLRIYTRSGLIFSVHFHHCAFFNLKATLDSSAPPETWDVEVQMVTKA